MVGCVGCVGTAAGLANLAHCQMNYAAGSDLTFVGAKDAMVTSDRRMRMLGQKNEARSKAN